MLRKLRAYVLLLAFSLFSALLPMRAYAFVPPALGWMGAGGFAGGGAVAEGAVAANPVGAAVVAIGALVLINQMNSSGSCTAVAISVSGMCAPPGWGRNSNGAPLPPNSTNIITGYQWTNTWPPQRVGLVYSTMSALCTYIESTYNGVNVYWTHNVYPNSDQCMNVYGNPSYHMGVTLCPAGYTANGTLCTLTDSTQVLKPQGTPCQIQLSNGAFVFDAKNPACSGVTAVSDGTISWRINGDGTVTGTDGTKSATLAVTGQNLLTLTQTLPATDDAGNPVTQTATTSLNTGSAVPIVTGQTNQYNQGQNLNASGTLTTSGTATVSPSVVAPQVSCAQLSNCNWATAQTQSQQLAAEQQTASSTAQIHQDLQASSTALVDTVLPSVPSLYSQKYPNGLTGVWNQHSAALSQTRFMQGIQKMFPSIGGGGQVPSWTFGFDGVPGLHGSQSVSVASYVWDFVKLTVIISSVFTARKIIFG